MVNVSRAWLVVLLLLAIRTASAFNGHIVNEGPLKLSVGDIEDVTEYDRPREVKVTVRNNETLNLDVHLQMAGLVDEWYAVGPTRKHLSVGPGKEAETTFRIAAGKGAFSALYPIHVYATFQHGGQEVTAHAVQIFKTNFKKAVTSSLQPSEMPVGPPVNIVPADGALPLWLLRTHRVAWRFYDKPLVYMSVGWQGSSAQSAANLAYSRVIRGPAKDAIVMHPPWRPAGGTIFAEYLLKLPDVMPIKLVFANAIRDHTASEPASDGVTFRVWAGDDKLFERHTDSKKWVDGQVDLSKFAGKKILLRLESHPGPRRDTTCDSSYWGEPLVVAGAVPAPLTDSEREKLRSRARDIVKSQRQSGRNEFVFSLRSPKDNLEEGYLAALVLGKSGLADSAIAFGKGGRCVVFDGLQISVLRHKVGAGPSPIIVRKVNAKRDGLFGKLTIEHRLLLGDEEFDLIADVWKDKGGLRIRLGTPFRNVLQNGNPLKCPKRITDIALGQADQKAPRVYYGHGYCIIEPETFRANFGGHNLSTSHVGFDFQKGISLLVACDNPPDYLEVNPEQRRYSLHTHLDATMTFVPSVNGAFDCARRYRPLFDKKPAAGFKRKAGRFVFDIWGGRYAEIAETMKRMIAYGLTDSLLTMHVWQRWGYDYRLPDIYPPLPTLGTVEDVQRIAKVCTEHDIPWGLHDNYIDFYPDATDYSYDHICFTEQGEPIKAWLNKGRNAQSYRWRPDHIMPFIKHNLQLIKPNLRPTHYFIDVFTSLPCFDFYDRDGNFHSMLETRKCWGEAFAWIRDYVGANAPTTSEAGHDQLIGYLDGSDCQHMTLSPEKGWPHIRISCKDWERVPWFDAVLHDKFSLHGVGYPSRYKLKQAQNGQRVLESDDYISAEVLEGHALMIDRRGFGRGAVRKYWLAQDFIRSIALDTIENVRFLQGDIHRQIVEWKSGARIYVNRGDRDWKVAGKILPQYGYFAKNNHIESSIERINGVIVEQSRGPSRCYVNARGFNPSASQTRPVRQESKPELSLRWNIKRIPIDFGPVLTDGALRCELKKNMIVVTPLPDSNSFTVTMHIDKLTGMRGAQVESVIAVDADGGVLRKVEFETKRNLVKFRTRKNDFGYHVRFKRPFSFRIQNSAVAPNTLF